MVYRGKPSKGCKECRSMKIKCGQQLPECAQCIKGKRQCSGYRDQLDLMFLDESSSVRKKAQAGTNSRNDESSASQTNLQAPGSSRPLDPPRSPSPMARLLHSPLEDQVVTFFFANYAGFGPNSGAAANFLSLIYQQDQSDGAVRTIVRALGLGGLSRVAKDIQMRNAALSNYVSAISKINELLRHPKKAKEDTTIFAIVLLAIFETITGCNPQSIAAFAKHIRGIITLLEMRGPSQLDHEVGLLIYLQMRGHLIVACLQHYIPFPPVLLKWSEKLDDLIPDLQPDKKLADKVIDFTNLRAGVHAGTFKNPTVIISRLLLIDKQLDSWDSSLPPSWECKEYLVKNPTDEILEPITLEYRSIWTCSIYLKWMCIRCQIHEMILDCIAQYGQPRVRLNSTSGTEGQFQESHNMLELLTSRAAASIPYMLGYRRGEKPKDGNNVPAMGGMLSCWPLFVIGGIVGASDALRAWAIRRLLSIGAEMGIYLALSLATVLRTRKEIAYWKERLAKEPIEKLPTGDNMEMFSGDILFEEGSAEWMSRSDLNAASGQFQSLRAAQPEQCNLQSSMLNRKMYDLCPMKET